MLNPNVKNLDTPAIPLALSWADLYQNRHGPLIDLSQAVPNYPPHKNLLSDLAKAASDPSSCGYGEIEGEDTLRGAYSEYVNRVYRSNIQSKNIHITAGCNQAFFATLIAVAPQGSSVLMVNPCYFNHKATAEVLGLATRYVDAESANGFLPTISAFESALDDSVSVVALVSPNNPTGAVYPSSLLRQIYDLCVKKNIVLIVDETYREFASQKDGQSLHELFVDLNWQDHFIQLYSFSKTYCIPGHRVGAIVAGETVINNVAKVMDNLQICAPRSAQLALGKQIGQLDSWVQNNNEQISKRTEAFKEVLTQSEGWSIQSIGAYFAYVERPCKDMDSISFVKLLASEYGILPLPGAFFGNEQDSFLRFAFANVEVETIHSLGERLHLLYRDRQ